MKRLLLILSICLISHVKAGELIPISINNTAPRVGDEIELMVDIQFIQNTVKEQLKLSNSSLKIIEGYGLFEKQMVQKIEFSDTGKHQIGPFFFELNKVIYMTDSLTIHVSPQLPNEEGVWIRTFTDEDGTFLIIEQKIDLTKNKKIKSIKKTNYYQQEEDSPWIELNKESLPDLHFSFARSQSNSSDSELSTYYVRYKVTKKKGVKGPVIVGQSNFDQTPRKVKISEITID
jgi:hypothetical protein